jgi:hypothetical protein
MSPSSPAGSKDQPRPSQRPEDQPPSGRGSVLPPLGGVGHVTSEGGAVFLQLITLIVRDARGPAAAQRHAV